MREINFENVNLLNNRANMLSGNLLPMTADDSFPMFWRIYRAVVWSIELIHAIGLIAGLIVTPKEKALKDGIISIVVITEATFLLAGIYTRKKLTMQVIGKMNDILRTADEIMKDIVKTTLKPIIIPFIIYGVASVISVTIWTIHPIVLVFEKSTFYYVDYNLPAAFSPEPFSVRVLIPSTIIMTMGAVYLFLRKYSLDVYMMHLVLMLTAQYRYTAIKLALLYRSSQQDSDNSRKKSHPLTDLWMEKELKALCRHQNNVLFISIMLRKLLSVNFSLLYLNSVFRFCFLGILMSTIPSLTFMEGISILSFAAGSVMQFFLLCSSVQTLSDASAEVTDKAFDEGWYQFQPSIKRIFILLILSNNIECKIAAVEKFNLSLPSFMTIMNQSYSIALLFLKAK
ncbi:odorant receptor 85f-like isoform X1 [Polyergus mexicanus]|uniref:odorant receptor 85f-like isoform X1 n=1 Tax=Polyergus mexicanus TaxID=615972 RepID=UPI0038B5EAAF